MPNEQMKTSFEKRYFCPWNDVHAAAVRVHYEAGYGDAWQAAQQPAADQRAVMQAAIGVIEEAQNYTSSPSWSPSMTDELKAVEDRLRQALAAPPLPQVAPAPEGWKLVPIEATASMLCAVTTYSKDQIVAGNAYRVMLDAAPETAAPARLPLDGWIRTTDRMPEWSARDDTTCFINGKEIPPTLFSETVLVALKGGGVRTDKLTTIEGKSAGWWNTYGERVTAWMPTPKPPIHPAD